MRPILGLLAIVAIGLAQDRVAERERMVAEQIEARGIQRPELLRAMR